MTHISAEMALIFGRTMFDELVSKGFDFRDPPEAVAFMVNEIGRDVNASDYFTPTCQFQLSECIDQDKIEQLFGEVISLYMRNRLMITLPVLAVLALMSIVSNILGIKAVVGIRHKLPRHWVLMNLSLSDSLLAPLNAIKVTSEVLAYSAFDELFRTYFNSAWQIFFLLCPLSLFFLALDNVVAVVAPFYYERRSGSGARVMMLTAGGVTWFLIILLIALLHVFGVQHSQTVQLIVATVLLMIIATTVTLYLALAMKAEIYRRKLMVIALPSSVVNNDRQQRELLRSRMKTTATTLSIVLTLAGFWSPFIAYLLIPDSAKFAHVPFYIRFLCSALCLFQLATAIDPIVYCCRMVEVRRSLVSSVFPAKCRERFIKSPTASFSAADKRRTLGSSVAGGGQAGAGTVLLSQRLSADTNVGCISNSKSLDSAAGNIVIAKGNDIPSPQEAAEIGEHVPLRSSNENE